jgi:hypothetical protein
MGTPNELLASNLIEALQQVQRYVVLGLGASVSALALTGKSAATERVTVPGTSVAVAADVARTILLALCILAGAMASYAAESTATIADRLRADPDLRSAACTFPSIATSPYLGVRLLSSVLPLVFCAIAVYRMGRRFGVTGRESMVGWLVFLLGAYYSLTIQMVRTTCVGLRAIP